MILLVSMLCMTDFEAYAGLPFRESPCAPLVGVVPLDREQAARHNHFRFSRDREGRIVRVVFRLGDEVRNLDDSANHFFHAPELRIRYEGNLEIRTYRDRFGNPTLFWGDVAEEHYLSDESGKRTRLVFFDRKGEPVENAWGIAEYRWQAIEPGTVIEERVDLEGRPVDLRPGFQFGRLRLIYDDRGFLVRMDNIDANGNPVENESGAASDVLEYDERGLCVAWNVKNARGLPERGNGPDVARGVMRYNRFGREIGIAHFDENGEPMVNAYGFHASQTFYDRYGNMAIRIFLDTEGRPTEHALAGYRSLRMVWDTSGTQRLAMVLFGADGAPIEHRTRGYAEVVRELDARGRVAAIAFYDAEGRSTLHRGLGVARIEMGYDHDNRLTRRAFYDPDGRPIRTREGHLEVLVYDGKGYPQDRGYRSFGE